IAEGSANYGIDLAFPDNTRPDTERDVLMPLPGIAPPGDDRYWKLNDALKTLQGARLTIAQQYLDGVIDRPTAVALTRKYLLVSPKRAEQSVAFTDQYRSYVINYGIGEEMVRAFIERGGPDRDESWRRMTLILSEPTLPADPLAPSTLRGGGSLRRHRHFDALRAADHAARCGSLHFAVPESDHARLDRRDIALGLLQQPLAARGQVEGEP